MAFVQTLYWRTIVARISQASHSVYVSLPSIDEELSELLVSIKTGNRISVKVCIDNCEDVIRNGYGETKGIDNLIAHGIELKECKGSRISFIIVDESGYVVFPESRIFSAEPTGPNAIELDPFTATRLIAYFFPAENDVEKEKIKERLENGFGNYKQLLSEIDAEVTHQHITPVSRSFDFDSHIEAKTALKKVPPIQPDLQRRIKTYTAKVQFIELRFTGVNLQSKTINIPKDAVPIANADLKKILLAKMRLFQDMELIKGYEIFSKLKKEVELLREEYLKPITCREGKSLIQLEQKEAFKERLEVIKKKIQEINKELPDMLETSMLQTKELIKTELLIFFRKDLPESINQFNDPALRERKLNDYVDDIVRRMPFPKTERLIKKISISEYFYDLTFQDFSDETLITELRKKEIMKDEDIKGIVEMKNAFSEKR